MILDDTRRWREGPPEHMTRHNGRHDDDEYNSRRNDGSNGYRGAYQARAWQARQRDTKGWPLFLFYLSCHKGNEDQLYYTATGREASASLLQTDPS